MRHIIIADDLTGAVDSLAAFAQVGARSLAIRWTEDGLAQLDRNGASEVPEIVAIASASRNLPKGAVTRRMSEVADWVSTHAGTATVIKKIDSGLRGAIALELGLIARALQSEPGPLRPLLVVPALPAQGRSTVSGTQLVHGVPVSEAEFSSDVLSPVRSSVIADHIPDGYTTTTIELDVVRSGCLTERLQNALVPGAAVVIDAETDVDLDVIARASCFPHNALIVASSGFISAMARLQRRSGHTAEVPGCGGPTIVVTASTAPATRQQVEWIASESTDVAIVHVGSRGLTDPRRRDAELERAAGALDTALRARRDVVVALKPESTSDDAPTPAEALRDSTAINVAVAFLAATAVRSPFAPRNLVLLGGDTADAVCADLGIKVLRVVGEAGPGAIHFRDGECGCPLNFVARSGAFGTPEDLADLVRTLSKEGDGDRLNVS
jgi:D-threonate/D-erythronate kinase